MSLKLNKVALGIALASSITAGAVYAKAPSDMKSAIAVSSLKAEHINGYFIH